MKIRICNRCKRTIEKDFVKCCKSELINHQQKLTYLGDLCLECWGKTQ
jgi:hypothetical protein